MIQRVFIIYNPNSTGDGEANARAFSRKLEAASNKLAVRCIPTEYAHHAFELAKQYADANTMIISSSGDGGFHEVVNGVLTSKHPDSIVGLLPSGNANDHYNANHHGDTIKRIIANTYDTVDVLTLRWSDKTIYAHSYAGVGFTADIGKALNKTTLTPLREAWIVLVGIVKRRSVKLRCNSTMRRYDSLVAAVITRMSKYVKTGADDAVPDGKFSVLQTPYRSLGWLLLHLLRRTQAPVDPRIESRLSFETVRRTNLQCDGELYQLPAHTALTITAEHRLREII